MGQLSTLNRRSLAEQVDTLADNLNTNVGILEAVRDEVLRLREQIGEDPDGDMPVWTALGYHDRQMFDIRQEYLAVLSRGVWGRLRWLVLGR